MTDLKPCPFCGGENVKTSYKDTFNGDFRRGVYCADCCGGIYPYYNTEAEAIDAWNSRVEQECAECAEGMGRYADSLCDPLKHRIAELEKQRDVLLRCLENDWNIRASWDGLRKFWSIELTEEGVRLRDAESNSRAERTCKQEERGWGTEGDHARVWLTCGHDCMVPTVQDLPNYCPNCGAKVVGE